jgi:two-component system NtrC family sensor kinase
VEPIEHTSPKTVRLALRWMLILATALILSPPGGIRLTVFDLGLVLAFVASNVALTALPERVFLSRNLEYVVVVADTFLVSLALFRAGLEGGDLPLAFFLNLLLAALGTDLLRIVAGATVVSGFYLYLMKRRGVEGVDLSALLMRIPFLYTAALYYGHLVHQGRKDQARTGLIERERIELKTFHEITAATTSTLELREVFYLIVQRIAQLVGARRCSVLTVDAKTGTCSVLASSDNPGVCGLVIDLDKYPEVRRAIDTRETVVINDIAAEPLMQPMKDTLDKLGYQSILVLPILYQDFLLGMLFLRAARVERRFTREEITACQVVANASASAIKNALLYEQLRHDAHARQQEAEKLQKILDQFPDLIYTTDREGRFTEFSRGGETMLGLSRGQVIGSSCLDLYPDPEARDRIRNLLEGARPLAGVETTVRGREGGLRDVLVAASPLKDAAGAPCGTVGIIKDITDLKSARRSLQVTEKLSAMGELVSGVAHELNNPLTGVLGYAQLLMGGATDARQRKSVERIFESALRCQKIVQNLLAFARRYPSEKRYLGLNGIIEKTLDLKAYQLRVNNLKVVKSLDPLIPKTMLDFNQMQQVLLNLITNAEHAIASNRGQGTLSLSTAARDGMIRLEVRDDGPGMPPEVLARIFDPFFTTKEVGEGAGLGLSVSYGIVKDHGGRIWAESRAGEGTSIMIEVPVVADAASEATPGAGQGPALAGRTLSILAVDDEAVILDLIVDAFGRDGRHTIDTAGSAREAIQKLERRTYDILLLDLKMPEMDGQQLFEEIRRRWPDMGRRVVFASGDTLHPATRHFLDHSGCPCVDKPFKLEHLANTIATLAGGAAPHPRSPAGG